MSSAAEHIDKYERLAQTIGVEALLAILPKPVEQLHAALDEGDEHLNKWGNGPWDRVTGYTTAATEIKRCGCCRQVLPVKLPGTAGARWYDQKAAWAPPWDKTKGLHLSMAERCCVLKHVAQYHTNYDPKEETNIG